MSYDKADWLRVLFEILSRILNDRRNIPDDKPTKEAGPGQTG